MTVAGQVSRIIGKVGETVTYRAITSSLTDPTTTFSTTTLDNTLATTDVVIKASVRQYKAQEVGGVRGTSGLVREGDREIRIAASDVNTTPRPNETILIGAEQFNIVSVDTRFAFNKATLHIIQVRGT